mmetsp:Transcript_32551/g.93733  ORF Transcript_32551/g.93733 Transcript_32551/m.93733 type:complete len:260 (+) Transcript_32551:401-1180(+)
MHRMGHQQQLPRGDAIKARPSSAQRQGSPLVARARHRTVGRQREPRPQARNPGRGGLLCLARRHHICTSHAAFAVCVASARRVRATPLLRRRAPGPDQRDDAPTLDRERALRPALVVHHTNRLRGFEGHEAHQGRQPAGVARHRVRRPLAALPQEVRLQRGRINDGARTTQRTALNNLGVQLHVYQQPKALQKPPQVGAEQSAAEVPSDALLAIADQKKTEDVGRGHFEQRRGVFEACSPEPCLLQSRGRGKCQAVQTP